MILPNPKAFPCSPNDGATVHARSLLQPAQRFGVIRPRFSELVHTGTARWEGTALSLPGNTMAGYSSHNTKYNIISPTSPPHCSPDPLQRCRSVVIRVIRVIRVQIASLLGGSVAATLAWTPFERGSRGLARMLRIHSFYFEWRLTESGDDVVLWASHLSLP